MDIICSDCNALHWKAERAQKGHFGLCCDGGQVQLPILREPPRTLRGLFASQDPTAVEFRENITQYNAALAFTSLGVDEVDHAINRYGPKHWVFRIHGNLRHLSGALCAPPGESPSYSQLYLYDPTSALRLRMDRNPNIRQSTMKQLQDMISSVNPYTRMYQHAYEVLRDRGDFEDVSVRLQVMPGNDRRRYNLPSSEEVAMILPGDHIPKDSRDIVLHKRTPSDQPPLLRITERHPAYSPLHYVLLFPYGESGWHENIPLYDVERGCPKQKRVSQSRYAAFRLHPRREEFSSILHGGRLLQQYAVDMWASAEQNKLNYLYHNQGKFRATVYSGLEDAVATRGSEVDLGSLGKRIVLPSSHIGSSRHMQQRFQDAMAIARYYQKVDMFLTMTANPDWDEIQCELLPVKFFRNYT
ncbi:hypothetical protein K435DRAFT_823131 [Dendrothele bispora CBS 962.96]|uniref:Helitron helicase-like domain-containing protein n=2 Tax=Dendrothele bispora (strain CBS 962.96) TaxID=1314807 RepID=A0A4S8L428_DENBC|nr:hypothetical protein K435DRAFT_823131 [Dendrothele bispora CBS 962.96]